MVARAAQALRDNAEEYVSYVTLEMGKLIAEARAEVALSADILDYYADRAEALPEGRSGGRDPATASRFCRSASSLASNPGTSLTISSRGSSDPN